MKTPFNIGRSAIVAGIGWPILCIVFMKLVPGPVDTPLLPDASGGKRPSSTPPTDSSGSTQYLSSGGSSQGIKIFWDVPEQGRVHVTIEVPGNVEPDN